MWLTIANVVGVAPVWVAIATDQVGTDHAACVYLLQWCSRCLVAPVYCGMVVMANNRFAVQMIGLPAAGGVASGYQRYNGAKLQCLVMHLQVDVAAQFA